MTVYAGSHDSNPVQGMLLVIVDSADGRDRHVQTYDTPTAAGPVKVISEAGGILTLQSISGSYRIPTPDWDPDRNPSSLAPRPVTTPGGATYYFNMRTKTFQNSTAPTITPQSSHEQSSRAGG